MCLVIYLALNCFISRNVPYTVNNEVIIVNVCNKIFGTFFVNTVDIVIIAVIIVIIFKNNIINDCVIFNHNFQFILKKMSIPINSIESILEYASKYYKTELKPYYTDEYVLILKAMFLNLNLLPSNFKIYIVPDILNEPIISLNEFILISVPLVAEYINIPLLPLKESIEVANYDNFQDLFTCVINKKEKSNKVEKKLKDSYIVTVYCILCRLVLMIQHWKQHVITKTEKNLNHTNIRLIEMAKQ